MISFGLVCCRIVGLCSYNCDQHNVYIFELWNQKKEEDEYKMIFTDNLKEQTKVNYEEREKYKNEKNMENEDDA